MKKLSLVLLCIVATFLACNTPDSVNQQERLSAEKKRMEKEVAFQREQLPNYGKLGFNIREQVQQIEPNSDIGKILHESRLAADLDKEMLAFGNDGMYNKLTEMNSGDVTFTVGLVSSEANVHAGLVILPINIDYGIYEVYIVKMMNDEGSRRLLVSSVASASPFIDIETDVYPMGLSSDEKEKIAKFRGCIRAAWNDITNDLSGQIACALCPQSCLSACLLACGYNAVKHSGYTTPECIDIDSQSDALNCLCSLEAINCSTFYVTQIPSTYAKIPVNLAFVSSY